MSSFGTVLAQKKSSVQELVKRCQGSEEGKDKERAEKKIHDELVQDELKVREYAYHNVLQLVFVNGYSSVKVFLFYLISIESLISIGLSVGMTIYAYNRIDYGEDSTFDGSIMTWVLLSFAVITPITSTITMAFRRREAALVEIALLRATFSELFTAHAIWDWDCKPGDSVNTGRSRSNVDWKEHCNALFEEIKSICTELTRLLTLPSYTRARHKITRNGKKEAEKVKEIAARLQQSMAKRFAQLAFLCEILKREGLPGNEAARLRQWERMLVVSTEKLRMIKMYRTPQALRSFSRLFSIFLPPFYVPYYVEMARDLNSLGTAIAFSVITSLALTSLFEAVSQMEDPFVQISVLDGVNVKDQLVDDFIPQLRTWRNCYFPNDNGLESMQEETIEESEMPSRTRPVSAIRLLVE